MPLKGLYQVGYVTRDIDRAIELFRTDEDLSDFSRFELDLQLETSSGQQMATVKVATAWAGTAQIELIEPISGSIDTYIAALPDDVTDATPRFHHVAVRRNTVEEMHEDVANLGLPILFKTGGAGIFSVFVDARSRLGHHLEFVTATPEGWAMLGWPNAADSPEA